MAHTSMQKFKTLHSPACRKDQDNDSNAGKPSCGTVEDVKDWRSKRKASTHKGSSKKNLRPSSSHSVISGGTSVRGSKWKTDTNEDCPKKKIRGSNDANTNEPSIVFIEGSHVRQSERKAHNDTDSSSKMQRSDLSLSSSICSSSDEDNIYGIPFSVKTSRAEFEANYIEIYKIAKGGFGAVYAGYRKEDVASVAIKHIPKEKVQYSKVVNNGKVYKVIDEVALMVKAAGGAESPGRSAAISLLDCYDLEEDLLLIMERPVPSMDLHQYRNAKRGFLLEDEAKTILRQMVDAAIEMHTNGVFHRDIKLENILIETGSHVLRARVIDFGCGCLMIKGYYYRYSGMISVFRSCSSLS
ncbi:hypothetical protein EPR50_G00000680 [Perca flavescens]|uniref:non-specific serine/threonine protein kinase n=1 Tax=Perca flavescens TaxID=8167 RepID=A0A484DMJ7_PERFV|nr:hypothetical protein EPR50_G00000680 [Perca flavescens]